MSFAYLSVARLLFALAFLITLLRDHFVASLVLFGVSFALDVIDTRLLLRRVRSFLYPLTTRLLLYGSLLFFVLEGSFFLWFLLLLVFRDILTQVIRVLALRNEFSVHSPWYTLSLFYSAYGVVLGLLLPHSIIFVVFLSLTSALLLLSFGKVILLYIYSYRQVKKRGTKLHKTKLVVLANPKSHGNKHSYRRFLLKKFVKRRGAQLLYLPTHKVNMYEGIEHFIAPDEDIIIAGGDGSFQSALAYPGFKGRRLGYFPLGAGNALYSLFYRGKGFAYLQSLFSFRSCDFDVMELSYNGKKLETFFLSIGIDAQVLEYTKRTDRPGIIDYLRSCLRLLFRLASRHHLRVRVDGKLFHLNNASAFILGKVPYYGYGLRSIPLHSPLSNGKIVGVACVNVHERILDTLVRTWGFVLGALGIVHAPLVPFRGKEFVIESDHPFALQAGGEFLGHTKKIKVKISHTHKVLLI